MASECMNSSLDLFSSPPLQSNVLKTVQVVYSPITTLEGSNSLEFHIPSNGKYYHYL